MFLAHFFRKKRRVMDMGKNKKKVIMMQTNPAENLVNGILSCWQ